MQAYCLLLLIVDIRQAHIYECAKVSTPVCVCVSERLLWGLVVLTANLYGGVCFLAKDLLLRAKCHTFGPTTATTVKKIECALTQTHAPTTISWRFHFISQKRHSAYVNPILSGKQTITSKMISETFAGKKDKCILGFCCN